MGRLEGPVISAVADVVLKSFAMDEIPFPMTDSTDWITAFASPSAAMSLAFNATADSMADSRPAKSRVAVTVELEGGNGGGQA